MTTAAPTFRRGGEAAQEDSKSAGGFRRTNFLSIEEDKPVFLRYLTDEKDWIYVDQHAGALTKPKPANLDAGVNWPSSMPATCRHDKAFEGIYSDCYICDNNVQNNYGKPAKPTIRIWALACLREEVIGTEALVEAGTCTADQIGKRIGFKDAIRKVAETDEKGEPTGKEIEERALVVVNMAPNNYFNALTAIAQVYGTVCDRDYVVKRSGKGTDTEYANIALSETPNLKPGTESWKRYETAIEEQSLDLGTLVADRASDEYYGRFWDPAYKVGETKATDGSTQADVPAKADDGVDEERLAAMRDRVRASTAPAASEID